VTVRIHPLFKSSNLWFLVKFYLTTVFIFVAAKLVFILCNAPATPLRDILAVVRHGLSLDLSTALYFLVIPLLAVIASRWMLRDSHCRACRLFLRSYYAVISVAFALAFVADTSLYAFWAFKLDASCLQYLSQPGGITASVSVLYLLVRFLLFVLFAFIFFLLYSLPPVRPLRRGLSPAYAAFIPFLVIGIRGGLSESTTNIGQVYFSENQFLNHAAVNPVFSFIYSLSHQVGDISQYQFMTDDDARRLTAGVYTTASVPAATVPGGFAAATVPGGFAAGDSPASPAPGGFAAATVPGGFAAGGSLLATRRPSIVIILMESAGEQFASVMPRLQRLKREGVCFSRCYANSWRTDRGTLSLLSGYPSFPTLSVMKMPHKSRTLPAIAATLRSQGYTTHYLYGGDINFTNMRSYLLSTGWQTLTSQDDFTTTERNSAKWGVRDDITFGTLLRIISSHPSPLLIGYSTLSSHEPWDVPLHRHSDPVLNAFAYLDDCLGTFIDSLKATPQWRDLLVIVTADHGIIHGSVDNTTPEQKNHIPMLWLGGAVSEPRTIDTFCNQSDLAATLLAQLGLPHTEFTFSRDILSATYTHPTAVNNYNNAQWLIDASGHLLYDLDAHKVTLYSPQLPTPHSSLLTPHSKDSLLLLNQAILQLTTTDLSNR